MDGRLTRRKVLLGARLTARLLTIRERLDISGRGHDRVLRVARTIADLGCEARIGAAHVAEAVQYRRMDAAR
jgi:magnesium chelatase family protein